MKPLLYLFIVLLIASCDKRLKTVSDSSEIDKSKTKTTDNDSILTFSFVKNFSHNNISNTSDQQIDLLFNSVNRYLGGQANSKVHFRTECMRCEPIQEYLGGLLFAKRLLISKDQIKYYKTGFGIHDSINRIEFIANNVERENPKFRFTYGKGSIKHIGVSCNDADYNKVRLSYSSGEIVIDSLINATFFEYDLNTDGQKEQYLIGTRNCSQEFVLLRIRNPNDIK